jgi:hypothetical protein
MFAIHATQVRKWDIDLWLEIAIAKKLENKYYLAMA